MTLNRRASLLFLICFGLYFVLSLFMPDSDYGRLLALSAFMVSIPAFLIPAVTYRRIHKFPICGVPRLSHIMICLALGVGCIFLNLSLICLSNAITYGVEINSTAVDVSQGLGDVSLLMIVLTVAVIPAVSEEFLMRGALFETWRRTHVWGAAVLTSLLFALLHGSPSNLIVYLALGMLFAVVYNITGNVWTTVIIHFVNNMISVLATAALMGLGETSEDVDVILDETVELTRGAYVGEFLSYLLIAGIIIVPMLMLLKSSCRKHSIGMFATSEPAENGIPYAEGGEAVVDASARQPGGLKALLADPLLWVAVILLVAYNVFAGLIEFGVINVALE